ncbi:hypothetical protein MN608_11797 [Microdochium nivale]|nr:hypothetical protein MN608_11797 [Microdochium nivale]
MIRQPLTDKQARRMNTSVCKQADRMVKNGNLEGARQCCRWLVCQHHTPTYDRANAHLHLASCDEFRGYHAQQAVALATYVVAAMTDKPRVKSRYPDRTSAESALRKATEALSYAQTVEHVPSFPPPPATAKKLDAWVDEDVAACRNYLGCAVVDDNDTRGEVRQRLRAASTAGDSVLLLEAAACVTALGDQIHEPWVARRAREMLQQAAAGRRALFSANRASTERNIDLMWDQRMSQLLSDDDDEDV